MGIGESLNAGVGVLDWFLNLFMGTFNFLISILSFFLHYPLLGFSVFVIVYLIVIYFKRKRKKEREKKEKEEEEKEIKELEEEIKQEKKK